MKNLIKWLLYTSTFAAICAVVLCIATEKLVFKDAPLRINKLHIFVFFNTITIYNLHYYIKKTQTQITDRFAWSQKHKYVHVLLITLGLISSFVSLFFLSLKLIGFMAIMGLMALAYSFPVLPFQQRKRLKDWGILKPFVLALVWICVTVAMPLIYHGISLMDYKVEFIKRFLFVLPLCIAFDIRDVQLDHDQNIKTLPNVIGFKNCYRLMNVSLLLFCITAVVQHLIRYPHYHWFVSSLLFAVTSFFVLQKTKTTQTDAYYLLFVDGLMCLYGLYFIFVT